MHSFVAALVGEKGTSQVEAMRISEEIRLAISELRWSKGISQSDSQSVENSVHLIKKKIITTWCKGLDLI